MRRPESLGTGTSPAAAARWPALGNARRSPAATSSEAPRNGPKPGIDSIDAAWGCGGTSCRSGRRGSSTAIERSTFPASSAMISGQALGPGSTTDWALAAAIARAATSAARAHAGFAAMRPGGSDRGGATVLGWRTPVSKISAPLCDGVVECLFQAGKTLVIRSRRRLIIRTRSAIRSAAMRGQHRQVTDADQCLYRPSARSRRSRAVSAMT